MTASSRIFAELQSAIAPLGTSIPLGINAWAPTRAPERIFASWSTTEPEPIKQSSSTGAALKVHVVSDGAAIPDHGVESRGAMNDRAVLNRGLRPNADGAVVTTENGCGPHR